MDQNLKLNIRDYGFFSYSVSLFFHITLFIICFLYLNKGENAYLGKNVEVQLSQGGNLVSKAEEIFKSEPVKPEPEKTILKKTAISNGSEKELDSSPKAVTLNSPYIDTLSPSGYYNFAGSGNDTSGLIQVYSEKTLNVKIKYPLGWTFIDQDKDNKLDGVTFWVNNGIFNPPPYIFLEVKEKYLFNPSRYKFNTKLRNSMAYYNDPEELEGQVSQIFYIRTDTDQDFSIKLIMNGKDTFMAFQPIFFAMIKSFNFGKSFF
ncbi:MAG: hypothetical protein P4L27_13795 [Ignavibacteriaceae bacterium]|nr:hypothetical protein [Ignavibacteriaceae bacterium]